MFTLSNLKHETAVQNHCRIKILGNPIAFFIDVPNKNPVWFHLPETTL